MKRIALILTIMALFVSCMRNEKSDFEKHFLDKTLRINLIHSGNATEESFKIDKIYDDGLWYGRTKHLTNPYRYGAYHYEVTDVETNELIYSDGVSTVFSEWRLTDEAVTEKRVFKESIRIPYPQKEALITMYRIDSVDVMVPVWEYVLDRNTRPIIEPAKNHNNRLVRLLDNGSPKEKVDIVILGDGYTLDEISRFDADASRFYNIFINTEPFKSRKSDFNIHAVQVPPTKEGNALKTQYGIWGHDRYALAYDEWDFREYATQSPYDYAVILMNEEKNGGGSMYNLYTTTAIRSQSEDYVMRHELTHQIIGIKDQFYTNDDVGDTAYVSSYFGDNTELINKILDLYTK